jgi:RNA polymerase sigma-70 factor (ECF subfamily)
LENNLAWGVLIFRICTPLSQVLAMAHRAADHGPALERFREYLHLLARLQLDPRWQGKVDLSGVVQQTLLEAHCAWEQLQNWDEARQAAWLRRALAHNLTDEVRKLGTARREAALERSLDQAVEQSSARLESWLADEQSSPNVRAERNEQMLALADALGQLAPDQRTAVELRHLHGSSLAEVAGQMERSKEAVAKLLFRGLKRLRELLEESEP